MISFFSFFFEFARRDVLKRLPSHKQNSAFFRGKYRCWLSLSNSVPLLFAKYSSYLLQLTPIMRRLPRLCWKKEGERNEGKKIPEQNKTTGRRVCGPTVTMRRSLLSRVFASLVRSPSMLWQLFRAFRSGSSKWDSRGLSRRSFSEQKRRKTPTSLSRLPFQQES